MKERGPEATLAVLKAAHEKAPDAPVFHDTFGFALVYELLEKGRTPDAAAFHRLYSTFNLGFRKRLINTGKSYLKYGLKRRALDPFEKAVALDPDDTEAAELVKALRGAVKAL